MPRRARLRVPLLLIALVGILAGASGLAPNAPPPPVQARLDAQPDTAHLATIGAAFTLLMDHFYRTPEPAALLGAAWEGAAGALAQAGYEGTLPQPPSLPAEREATLSAFASGYVALAALAPPGLSQTDLAFAAVASMAARLAERHTAFLSPSRYRAFISQLSGDTTSVGLGVMLPSRPPWTVTAVAPAGPAEKAGIRPGDTVRAVDGQEVTGGGRAALVRALSGDSGSEVELTLERPGEGMVVVQVTRAPFRFPDLQAQVLPGGIGYIRLRAFSAFVDDPAAGPNVIRELDAALDSFAAAGVGGWVVDLRDNPGGFVFTANELAGRFLPGALTYTASDERGNWGQQLSSGRPFPVQRPLAVLVNGGSASSSELFASTMQEYARATVVGTRTAGALAGSLLFPLPDGAALQVAVEQARTGRRDAAVDEVGVRPDVEVADTRTAADYAAGRDPQLEAAVAALRDAPPPPSPPPPPPGRLSPPVLRSMLTPYLPPAESVPAAPLIQSPRLLGDLTLTVPSQYANAAGPVRDPAALTATVRERGWQGSVSRFYGQVPALNGPYLGVSIDLYSSELGAYAAVTSNDAPQLQRSVAAPVQLGDSTVAYRGTWVGAGTATIVWRSGRVVVTVTYSAVPGQESFEPVVALARLVDARLRQLPVPPLEPAAAAVPAGE